MLKTRVVARAVKRHQAARGLTQLAELGGREQALVDVAGFPNTYGPGNRVDLRLGTDSAGELYLLTKGDGWVRKLVPTTGR